MPEDKNDLQKRLEEIERQSQYQEIVSKFSLLGKELIR